MSPDQSEISPVHGELSHDQYSGPRHPVLACPTSDYLVLIFRTSDCLHLTLHCFSLGLSPGADNSPVDMLAHFETDEVTVAVPENYVAALQHVVDNCLDLNSAGDHELVVALDLQTAEPVPVDTGHAVGCGCIAVEYIEFPGLVLCSDPQQ